MVTQHDPLGLHWECTSTSINGQPAGSSCTWVPDSDPEPGWWDIAFEGAPPGMSAQQFFCMLMGGCPPPPQSGNSGGGGTTQPPSKPPADNGFTLGVRQPGQTWSNCMSATSGTYSINGVLPSSAQNGATRLLASNDVSQILFGDSSEGSAGLVVWEGGTRSVEGGVGQAMTAGRRTASIMDLNLAGKTGPAARISAKLVLKSWLDG